ncbi:MAG: hypothetical protein M0C28_08800 [Candidatus Moduliflexus flocculans]|nr:hypothetical protein [Candidatus Moduliflexus flocculans]
MVCETAAVILVGGLGNIKGTFVSAFALGMVMSVTGRLCGARCRNDGLCSDGNRFDLQTESKCNLMLNSFSEETRKDGKRLDPENCLSVFSTLHYRRLILSD